LCNHFGEINASHCWKSSLSGVDHSYQDKIVLTYINNETSLSLTGKLYIIWVSENTHMKLINIYSNTPITLNIDYIMLPIWRNVLIVPR